MAFLSKRSQTIVYSGDKDETLIVAAANNATSPAQEENKNLASGANTITVPAVGSFVPTAVTIVPSTGNTASITLKGVTGDTGVLLNKTDPTTIALDSTVTTFVLTAGATISGVRFIWS